MTEYFSSGLLDQSKLVEGSPGCLKQILLFSNGDADAFLRCYDVSSASEINNTNCLSGLAVSGSALFKQLTFPPLSFKAGLYCLLTGTGASYVVILSRAS